MSEHLFPLTKGRVTQVNGRGSLWGKTWEPLTARYTCWDGTGSFPPGTWHAWRSVRSSSKHELSAGNLVRGRSFFLGLLPSISWSSLLAFLWWYQLRYTLADTSHSSVLLLGLPCSTSHLHHSRRGQNSLAATSALLLTVMLGPPWLRQCSTWPPPSESYHCTAVREAPPSALASPF